MLGAGTNRMNIYVVRQATQGLANWVKTQGGSQNVAISYDSRQMCIRDRKIVNDKIYESMNVTVKEMPIEEAKKLGAMALFCLLYTSRCV